MEFTVRVEGNVLISLDDLRSLEIKAGSTVIAATDVTWDTRRPIPIEVSVAVKKD